MKITIKELNEAPNYQELKDRFGVGEETIIAYGDSIYVKGKQMTSDLLQHELTHCERQKYNSESAKRWYEMYMNDDKFRLQEEALAYHNQFEFCKRVFKDRNKQTKILWALAKELSSARYGNIIEHNEAMKLIDNLKSVII